MEGGEGGAIGSGLGISSVKLQSLCLWLQRAVLVLNELPSGMRMCHLLHVGFSPSHLSLLLLQFVHALSIRWRLSLVSGFDGRVWSVICLVRTSERAKERPQKVQLIIGVSGGEMNRMKPYKLTYAAFLLYLYKN